MRVERRHLVNPNTLRAQQPGHFGYDRSPAAVASQVQRQLDQRPPPECGNEVGRQQRGDSLGGDRGGRHAAARKCGPVQLDENLA